ncbi:MAG: hypothetical protein JSS30_08025 [Verrucomicrobia bacterium]|nr:hypothetical protein [Verrucomicrobiota bacterium]
MIQIKFWKKCVLALTCAALILGATVGLLYKNVEQEIVVPQSSEWQSYTSSDQSFAIQFPNEPKEKTEQTVIAGKNLSFQEMSAVLNESTYSVSYVDFPKHWKWVGTKKLLSKGFDAFIQSQQDLEALAKQNITTFHGLPALEYHLRQAGKEIEGKFVIVGNTLYRITVTYPLAVAETVQPDTFFGSFQVNG